MHASWKIFEDTGFEFLSARVADVDSCFEVRPIMSRRSVSSFLNLIPEGGRRQGRRA